MNLVLFIEERLQHLRKKEQLVSSDNKRSVIIGMRPTPRAGRVPTLPVPRLSVDIERLAA
jgi:hypothetical protein